MISLSLLFRVAMPGLAIGQFGQTADDSAQVVAVSVHLALDWFAGPGPEGVQAWLIENDADDGYASLRIGPFALTVAVGDGEDVVL